MTSNNRSRSRADDAVETEMEYDDLWPGRLPSSTYRYDKLPSTQGNTRVVTHPGQVQQRPIPARRSALPPAGRMTEEQPPAPPRRRSGGLFRSHPLVWIGFGMDCFASPGRVVESASR